MAASVKIDDALKARIQNLADQKQRSAHWVMREAIQQYVDREEASARFRQEAMASWIEYKRTGKHLTLDEVKDWLDTWGTPDEKGPPECHE
ncbi:MAG TPA: CopG family ribbon-helix-helix protein [Asticcacaulis sp.]|nr:CopG family ribbon-helix-helix protein [Asticcacaulis sp.]